MHSISIPIPTDLHQDLTNLKKLSKKTITSIILEGTKMRVKELGTQLVESRRRNTTLNDMVNF